MPPVGGKNESGLSGCMFGAVIVWIQFREQKNMEKPRVWTHFHRGGHPGLLRAAAASALGLAGS